jgi:hypothetical protein
LNHRTHPDGATLTETLAVLVCLLVAMAFILPALAQVGQTIPVSRSTHNLRVLHEALACYAADWNDRQFTAVPDDVGIAEGDCGDYVEWHCGCWPPLYAGSDCEGVRWGYFFQCAGDPFPPFNCPEFAAFPISFDPLPTLGAGVFRNPQVKSLHDYVNGKYYDPVYFAPLDGKAFRAALPKFAEPCEFAHTGGATVPSSYVLSPAAMYDPDVMRAPSQGGFQDPRTLDHGFRSPAVTQVRYPDLKTWMIEHNWLRNPPAACNPDYVDLFGSFSEECDPYLFNHGADAEPLAFFFDGSVQSLRTGDVADDDAQVLDQTGGVDGLWSRDTPLGETGYFGDVSVDGIVVSHHVLTTDGILGRDRLQRPAPRGGWR